MTFETKDKANNEHRNFAKRKESKIILNMKRKLQSRQKEIIMKKSDKNIIL